jgi:hypothetical protein
MPTRRTSTDSSPAARKNAGELGKGSTAQYRDRPTDDGMKGDGADEPNAGPPRMPRQTPSRRAHQTTRKTK